jgi:hypothetical protein
MPAIRAPTHQPPFGAGVGCPDVPDGEAITQNA